MTKSIKITTVKRSAIGAKQTPAKGKSIRQNLKATGQRVAKAIQQNAGNVSTGGIA